MDMREDLRFICATIDANLRHAESKHTAFVAFNGVAVFGGFGMLRNLSAESGGSALHAVLAITMLVLLCAMLTSIYSFLPVIVRNTETGRGCEGGSILFFEHIKLHTVDSYLRLLCDAYQVKPEDIAPIDRCIVSQIIVNARLASRKFAIFKTVAYCDMAAVIFGVGGFLAISITR